MTRIAKIMLMKIANLYQIWQNGTEPYANTITAENILSYRHFKTKSLRAGNHLPFHKAVEFFALQRCGTPHDMVFGYLGLTNSHIQIDYSMPILDLFVATLANWFLSAGFIRQDLTGFRGFRIASRFIAENNVTAPLQAFRLDPCEPLVQLLFNEVTKFFLPDFAEGVTHVATMEWFFLHRYRGSTHLDEKVFDGERKSKLNHIITRCIKFVKFMRNEVRVTSAKEEGIVALQVALEEKDAVMSATGESDRPKTYSEWAAHARAISEQIWQRFVEAGAEGEGGEGDMNDESSILAT